MAETKRKPNCVNLRQSDNQWFEGSAEVIKISQGFRCEPADTSGAARADGGVKKFGTELAHGIGHETWLPTLRGFLSLTIPSTFLPLLVEEKFLLPPACEKLGTYGIYKVFDIL